MRRRRSEEEEEEQEDEEEDEEEGNMEEMALAFQKNDIHAHLRQCGEVFELVGLELRMAKFGP
jgi:hypothetical protein